MLEKILDKIRTHSRRNEIEFTYHSIEEMEEENIIPNEVIEAIQDGFILENYPEHKRGACCLICGFTRLKRPLHIVCTTSLKITIIITVYEPKLPKFITPIKRR
jgi:hypothetical protein